MKRQISKSLVKYHLVFAALYLFSACSGGPRQTNQQSPLNDTGLLLCANETESQLDCKPFSDTQDALTGRDSRWLSGALKKAGGGAAAFDWSRIDATGDEIDDQLTEEQQKALSKCLRDNVTGLIWELKTNDPEKFNYADHSYVWNLDGETSQLQTGSCIGLAECVVGAYVDKINQTQLCGHSDWRVPSVQELSSIAVFSKVLPAVDKDFFPHHSNPRYFTAEQRADDRDFAWYVYFSDGSVSNTNKLDASSLRLVRGQHKLPALNCQENGEPDPKIEIKDWTVIDHRTGLEWQKCNANESSACAAISFQTPLKWTDALQYARQSTYADHNDWRLPNKNELETLVNRRCASPATARHIFPETALQKYWTSTPNNFNPDFAWAVGFKLGEHVVFQKTEVAEFRMVRDVN